jgi:hypothetical protein
VARQEDWKTIEAHVIEIQTDIPLTSDVQPDELIIKAEYADFLEQTGLNRIPEFMDLRITIPGGYQKLLDEICVCRCQIQEEGQKECSLQDSAASWYREIYIPFDEAVRERGMMRWFPNRTVTDIYVWMSEHPPGSGRTGSGPEQKSTRQFPRVTDRNLAQGTLAQPLYGTSLPGYSCPRQPDP